MQITEEETMKIAEEFKKRGFEPELQNYVAKSGEMRKGIIGLTRVK
jgi:hypothetical protein